MNREGGRWIGWKFQRFVHNRAGLKQNLGEKTQCTIQRVLCSSVPDHPRASSNSHKLAVKGQPALPQGSRFQPNRRCGVHSSLIILIHSSLIILIVHSSLIILILLFDRILGLPFTLKAEISLEHVVDSNLSTGVEGC